MSALVSATKEPRDSSSSAHVVVVEDELDVAEIIRDYLVHAGYRVSVFFNGREAAHALQNLSELKPNLLVLDIMLPEVSGTEILQELRTRSNVPAIMVTARVEEVDRLLALELGADDYLCKPFSPRELVARVRAVLRRTSVGGQAEQALPLVIDAQAQRIWVDGQDIELTPKEFAVLQVLARHPSRVYSRAAVLEQLYAHDLDVTDRAVDSHIKNIRRKLAAVQADYANWIRSVYGVGFSLDIPVSHQAATP